MTDLAPVTEQPLSPPSASNGLVGVFSRRYLLRLWLDTGLVPELPASWTDRYSDTLVWQQQPRAPIFDLSMRRAELAH